MRLSKFADAWLFYWAQVKLPSVTSCNQGGTTYVRLDPLQIMFIGMKHHTKQKTRRRAQAAAT